MQSAFVHPGGLDAPRQAKRCAIVAVVLTALAALSACEPEVGSARWCDAMREKPRGDWTANEALDFARHCLFESEE